MKILGYGDKKKIKLTTMNILRTDGIEDDDDSNSNNRCLVNDSKLSDNISRAKNTIFELAFCNPWDYFFTATLNPAKYDRTDLEKFHKDLTQWFRNYNKKYNIKIQFLLIPELHSDGKTWHMHGFLYGIPQDHLQLFKIGDTMGKALAEKVKNGDTVFNWSAYVNKFGFCSLEPIKNAEAASKYVTKYINKSLVSSVTDLNAHLYYHSRGLNKGTIKKKGTMSANIEPDFVNSHCSITTLDYSETLEQQLLDCIT